VSDGPRVLVVADDLIWAERLAGFVHAAGATAVRVRTPATLDAALASYGDPDVVGAAIVDLTARAYDGIDVVGRVAAAGRPVLAIAQHDDHALRKRALAAGATRVLAYQKLADDGPAVIATFLGTGPAATPDTNPAATA
jgi:CheY-like chemotaxis protein